MKTLPFSDLWRYISLFLFCGCLIGGFSSCKGKKKDVSGNQTVKAPTITYTPDFNADTAYRFIEQQLAFGHRVPGTKAHDQCALFLEQSLKSRGLSVIVQQGKVRKYDGSILNIKNIIGSFAPDRSDRILLCAHWDTRHIADHDADPALRNKSIPGANDGGSGVGVLLEIARQLSLQDPGVGVDIVLFDAEDQGQPEDHNPQQEDTWCLGSQYWGKNPHVYGYKARFGILLDMVGAGEATFLRESYSQRTAPDIVAMVWETASRLGYSDYFYNQTGGEITDDHYYVHEILKIPTINIIHQDITGQRSFFPHWHTHKDDIESIDRLTLKAVGNTVLMVLHLQKPA